MESAGLRSFGRFRISSIQVFGFRFSSDSCADSLMVDLGFRFPKLCFKRAWPVLYDIMCYCRAPVSIRARTFMWSPYGLQKLGKFRKGLVCLMVIHCYTVSADKDWRRPPQVGTCRHKCIEPPEVRRHTHTDIVAARTV